MSFDLSNYIDNRNRDIWDNIVGNWSVSFQESNEMNWRVDIRGKNATFFYVEGEHSSESFTHELLHVLMKDLGCFVGGSLERVMNQSRFLSRIFTPYAIDTLSNCLEHEKMLPIYLEMGYKEEEFLRDYFDFKIDKIDIDNIKSAKKDLNKLIVEYARDIIVFLFISFFDVNQDHNYDSIHKEIQKIDKKLFGIVQDAVFAWDEIDFSNGGDVYGQCLKWCQDFYNGLKPWITKNRKYFAD